MARTLYAEVDDNGRRKHTQAEIGDMLGAPQQRIAEWVHDEEMATVGGGNSTASGSNSTQPDPPSAPAPKPTPKPRPRTVKIHPEDRTDIHDRHAEKTVQTGHVKGEKCDTFDT